MKSKTGVAEFLYSEDLFPGEWKVVGDQTWKLAASIHLLINAKRSTGPRASLTAALSYSCFMVQACFKTGRYRSAMPMKIRNIKLEHSVVLVNMKKQRYT